MADVEHSEFIALHNGQIASLSFEGRTVGYLACQKEQGWGLGKPFGTQTFAWYLVTLVDGRQYVIEDYPPYATTPELAQGYLEDERALDDAEPPRTYEVQWLPEAEQAAAREEYGINRSPGTYRFEGTIEVEWWWSRLLDRMRGRRQPE